MIRDKQSFDEIESMVQSAGWKLFTKDMEEIAKGCLKKALDETDLYKRSSYLEEYKAYRRVLERVYGEYKTNYNKYKGEE